MYVISKDSAGRLAATNSSVKNNLKTWLTQYKMINDTIDIKPVRIVNFGISFSIVADYEENRFNVLSVASQRLKNYFQNMEYDIGEPLYVIDIYKELQKVGGVVDVLDVRIIRKEGGVYSDTVFDLDDALSNDGRYLNGEVDTIFELKYPAADVEGTIT